jgi:hypothetical protein
MAEFYNNKVRFSCNNFIVSVLLSWTSLHANSIKCVFLKKKITPFQAESFQQFFKSEIITPYFDISIFIKQ